MVSGQSIKTDYKTPGTIDPSSLIKDLKSLYGSFVTVLGVFKAVVQGRGKGLKVTR